MTSILDMKAGPPDYWAEISNFFLPLKYLITNDRFDSMVRDIDLYYLINGVFWIFVALSCGYYAFQRLFQVGPARGKSFQSQHPRRGASNCTFLLRGCSVNLPFINKQSGHGAGFAHSGGGRGANRVGR